MGSSGNNGSSGSNASRHPVCYAVLDALVARQPPVLALPVLPDLGLGQGLARRSGGRSFLGALYEDIDDAGFYPLDPLHLVLDLERLAEGAEGRTVDEDPCLPTYRSRGPCLKQDARHAGRHAPDGDVDGVPALPKVDDVVEQGHPLDDIAAGRVDDDADIAAGLLSGPAGQGVHA